MTKIKDKAIIPSLREKRRYLAYNIISEKSLDTSKVRNAIEGKCSSFLGQLEYGKAGIMIMSNGNKGIIRVSNKYLNKVRAAIMLIDDINNQDVIVRTVSVSGILNKARSRLNMVKIGGN